MSPICRPKNTLSTIEAILSESEGVKVYLPNIESLREYVDRSMDWIAKAELMLKSIPHPALEQLKNLTSRAKSLPVKLDLLHDVSLFISDWLFKCCLFTLIILTIRESKY